MAIDQTMVFYPITPDQPVDLAYLREHWGNAYYIVKHVNGHYVATRRDNARMLTEASADNLLGSIRADYQGEPVPRQYDAPPRTPVTWK